MEKSIYISIVILLAVLTPLHAQVTIGSGKEPESYSVLEMDSDQGGIRLNQLNELAKENVTNKLKNSSNQNLTKGLTIFDTKVNKTQYWDGTQWVQPVSVEANEHVNGQDGQFLMSNGTEGYPEWTTLNIPKVQTGDFYLYSSTVKKDTIGVDLKYRGENDFENYDEDLKLNIDSKEWYELKDLEAKIHIPDIPKKPGDDPDKVYTRLAVEVQTGAQMIAGPDLTKFTVYDDYTAKNKTIIDRDFAWISFTIGVFIGNDTDGYLLKQVRSTKLEGSAAFSFDIFTVIGAVDNLPTGDQTIKVAVKRRAQADFIHKLKENQRLLTVGKPVPSANNYNNFMAQSFLRANVYVIYD